MKKSQILYRVHLKKQLNLSLILGLVLLGLMLWLQAAMMPKMAEVKNAQHLLALVNLHASIAQPFILIIITFTFNLFLRCFTLYDKIREIDFSCESKKVT
jgi:hypothetical protein